MAAAASPAVVLSRYQIRVQNWATWCWRGHLSRLSRCQRIELLRSGERAPVVASHLPFAKHVHELDAGKDDAGATERLETQHRSDDALDRPVVLLDDVVEVLALPNRDRRVMLGVIAFDAGSVGAALVNRDAL